MQKICLNCGKPLANRQTKYCSNACQLEYQSKEKLQAWKNGEFDGVVGKFGLSVTIRDYLINKANNSCEKCGWDKVNPVTGKCPLEIHHKDGDFRNNDESNLEVLCPNCHSLTPNFKALNVSKREGREIARKHTCIDCGAEVSFGATRCRECETKRRKDANDLPVTREELKALIRTTPFTKIASQYGITDNGIRKWCDKYGLPRKVSEIKRYSDEEWAAL